MKLLCQPGKTFISCKNRHVLGGQKPKMGKQVVVPKWKIKLWIPSIWRGKLPWHIFVVVVVVAKYHYWEWSFCDTHNFLFFHLAKNIWRVTGREKLMSRIPLQVFWEEWRGRYITAETSGPSSLMHHSNSGGGSAPLFPPHRGQAIALISHCLITS